MGICFDAVARVVDWLSDLAEASDGSLAAPRARFARAPKAGVTSRRAFAETQGNRRAGVRR
ncbi:hypothetical protein [Streptomyces sp. NPDC127084]|uniref:hypothetical protein n=1 Tax=Streptomyces sp. NPDC127084 TaxID=3347133 RepID=UPI00364FACE9